MINTSLPQMRILLVEDDIDDCMFFKDALNETGINTTLQIRTRCTDIINLLGTAPEKLPHLIFLDLNMPLVSGHECLEAIRKLSYLDSTPVVIYSTSAIKQEVESTFLGGANLYLQKPSSFQLLVIALKKILQLDWENLVAERDRDNFVFKHIESQKAA
jgi:CheY-like chemotaxis protein